MFGRAPTDTSTSGRVEAGVRVRVRVNMRHLRRYLIASLGSRLLTGVHGARPIVLVAGRAMSRVRVRAETEG